MTEATGLVATVEVAREARARRIPSDVQTNEPPRLRVIGGGPIRVVAMVGRDPDLARAASRSALAAGADLITLLGTEDGRTFVERAELLRAARPELVVVLAAERADVDGLVDLIEALRFASVGQIPAPALLVAGDERTRARLAAAAGTDIEALPDARTDPGRDAIVARLRAIRRRGTGDVVLRDEALEAAARVVAADTGGDAVVLDVIGGSVSIAHARPDGATRAVHSRFGMGSAADRVVSRAGLDRVRQWIPRSIEAPALIERVFNRARWPDAVPASTLALALEMALAREAIAHTLLDATRAGVPVDLFRAAPNLVLTGRLGDLPRAAQAVLVALDGLEPVDTTLVWRDRDDALVAAAALASRGTGAKKPNIERTALVATMWPRRSATLRVTDANGVVEERIARGALLLLPTNGPVEVTASGTPFRARADALALGLIIDARGRPLALPPRDAERIPTLVRWNTSLDALPLENV